MNSIAQKTAEAETELWGIPVVALLEAIRLARATFNNPSLTTHDLFATIVKQVGKGPLVDKDGNPIKNPIAYVRRTAKNRLLDRLDHLEVVAKHAAEVRATSSLEYDGSDEDVIMIAVVDWLLTLLAEMEKHEGSIDLEVITTEGKRAVVRLPHACNVARTLRGIYLDGKTGCQMAVELKRTEPQIARYRAAGLRYVQLRAAAEL